MTSGIVSEEDFNGLIASRANFLLNVARHLANHSMPKAILTRPFLGELLSQSTHTEELLDAYGASNNKRWCKFRSLVAAIKLYSDVCYELLHIESVLPQYRLLPLEHDFGNATEQTLSFTGKVLIKACSRLVQHAELLNIPITDKVINDDAYFEILPSGRLEQDNALREIDDIGKIVTLLATAFLNMAANRRMLSISNCQRPMDYKTYLNSPISEDNLRTLQLEFHNLQSLYDTYVSRSNTEHIDPSLPILRGHISVVLHLLRVATSFAHYYERHMSVHEQPCPVHNSALVKPVTLLAFLLDYTVSYVKQYTVCAQKICQDMLHKYAEIGSLEVPVPRYRGFHVRPSTLVSMIAIHYGSDVKMEFDNQWYDASSPLELFRVNEYINARKRKWLISEILRLDLENKFCKCGNIRDAVYNIIMQLSENGDLVIYEQALEIDDCKQTDATLLEQAKEEIAKMLAVGKIDIVTDITVRFKGDKRVLQDIELLAKNGYGEDNFGNNISLPAELQYLRR